MLTTADIQQIVRLISPLDGRRWLHLGQAAAYAGIGCKRLKRLAADPGSPIVGFPDPDDARGTWIFDRKSLDVYRQQQAESYRGLEQKVIDSFKELGEFFLS